MLNQFSRTELLLGKEAMERLSRARVAVFGIGGVGGYTVEALVRSGVGAIDLIDDDKVCLTNLNRQIIATRKSVGKYKTDVMKERILDINPDAKVEMHKCFFLPENAKDFPFDTKWYYPESYAHLNLNDEGPQWKIFSAEELRRRDQQGHQSLKEKYGK